jgi:hypothetical protein
MPASRLARHHAEAYVPLHYPMQPLPQSIGTHAAAWLRMWLCFEPFLGACAQIAKLVVVQCFICCYLHSMNGWLAFGG